METIANGRKITVYPSGTIVDIANTTPPAETPAAREWSKDEFISLLTAQEWSDAKKLAQTDVNAEQFLDILMTARVVRESDPRLAAGLGYYMAKGVTTRTAAEILGA